MAARVAGMPGVYRRAGRKCDELCPGRSGFAELRAEPRPAESGPSTNGIAPVTSRSTPFRSCLVLLIGRTRTCSGPDQGSHRKLHVNESREVVPVATALRTPGSARAPSARH